jgi:hypothetical protein
MAHPRPSSGLDPLSGELKNTLSQEAIDVMLKELHSFFGEWSAVEDYKVATNPGDPETQLKEQKLFISYQSPEDDRFLPAIVCRLTSMREVRFDLGNAWENKEAGAKQYGGAIRATYQFTVGSLSSVDLDRITDYLTLFLLVIKVPDLQSQGIWLYPNTLNVSNIGTLKYTNSTNILRNQVNIDCYLHWFLDVPDENPTITNIAIRLQTFERIRQGLPPKEVGGNPPDC